MNNLGFNSFKLILVVAGNTSHMANKSIPIICYLLLLSFISAAQKPKLIEAISTSWSGGIAGKYGVGYVFIVEFNSNGLEHPMPDTLWIGNKCIPLSLASSPGKSYNIIKTVKKKKVTYKVWGGTTNEDEPYITHPGPPAEKKIPDPLPPIKYKGVALLSYRYKEQRSFYIIEKILTFGQPVNYP